MNVWSSVFFIILSVVLTKVLCVCAQGTRLMDKLNNRSMHVKPTIRGGGLVFISLALIAVPFLCYQTDTSLWSQSIFMFSIFLIAGISFLDDLYNLSAKTRFLVQCIVALIISVFIQPTSLNFGIFSINTVLLIIPGIFFMVLWAINHFNFMDGIDGFCAAQALFLFAIYGFLFYVHDGFFYAQFCFMFISVLLGFFVFNFPPAQLFMGDVGSATLGLITFCIALIGQQQCDIPILYWFMLNGLFLFDSISTLIRRILNKEKWSMPHKKHAYQRLRQSGVTVPKILSAQFIVNGIFAFFLILLNMSLVSSIVLITIQLGFMAIIYYLIEKIYPMF